MRLHCKCLVRINGTLLAVNEPNQIFKQIFSTFSTDVTGGPALKSPAIDRVMLLQEDRNHSSMEDNLNNSGDVGTDDDKRSRSRSSVSKDEKSHTGSRTASPQASTASLSPKGSHTQIFDNQAYQGEVMSVASDQLSLAGGMSTDVSTLLSPLL